jgi:molybdopterin molybdotransferase
MGKFDFVTKVLEELEIQVLFHKVKQRPGKPFWFGKSKKGKPVFALPGNPVSTQVCFYRYVLPNLNKALGVSHPVRETAMLDENFHVTTNLTCFLPVKIKVSPDAQILVTPVMITGSGDFATLANSDGFVELEAGKIYYKRGEVVALYRWGPSL